MRLFRILLLLLVLLAVAIYTQAQRLNTTNWAEPLEVVIFPASSSSDRVTRDYLDSLSTRDFAGIADFITREARRYDDLISDPALVRLGEPLESPPPAPPQPQANLLRNVWWSLKFRLWAWRNTPDDDSNFRRVRIFTVYHRADGNERLPHSVGVQKGLLGLVHAYADAGMTTRNNVVIAHELLHTLGASDKYGAGSLPRYPEGFAEPERSPLFPQRKAEIMGGTIAVSEQTSIMPNSLRQCVVGPLTAAEIGWIKEW
ncbi:MAG: hypothetical protein ABFS23_07385 [Pseudomonadota bacterium]